jgi:hypothetical protein
MTALRFERMTALRFAVMTALREDNGLRLQLK